MLVQHRRLQPYLLLLLLNEALFELKSSVVETSCFLIEILGHSSIWLCVSSSTQARDVILSGHDSQLVLGKRRVLVGCRDSVGESGDVIGLLVALAVLLDIAFVNEQLLDVEPDSAELDDVAFVDAEIVELMRLVVLVLDDSPDAVGMVLESVVLEALGVVHPVGALLIY